MEALSHQGAALGHDVPKLITQKNNMKKDTLKWTADFIGSESGVSGRQVKRYIRLTELIPDLLKLVDKKKITMVNAVEISFLSTDIQNMVYDYITQGKTLSKDKIARLRKLKCDRESNYLEEANEILYEVTGVVKQVYFSLTETQIASYFPKGYKKQQMEDVILTLLDQWSREQGR